MVQSSRLAAYIKRATLCVALACEMWTGASLADSVRAKPNLCPSSGITIFSCQTETREIISICLSIGSQLTVLSRQEAGLLHSEGVSSAEEAIVGGNAHGDNVVLQLESASRTTRLFLSGDPYDMSPAIFEITNGSTSKRVCVFASQLSEPGIITRNGVTTEVGLGNLDKVGLATHLANPPSWPGTR